MGIIIRGKHALVTGGSSGIGLYIAKKLVEEGAHVTILARNTSKLEDAQKDLLECAVSTQSGSKVAFQSADVTKVEQLQEAIMAAEASLGPVDILVSNAGAAAPGYFHELEAEVFERTMALNYMGSVNIIKAVVNGMVKRGTGHISIVSSAMGTMGFIGYSSYAPTKYALRGLADCLRNELMGTGPAETVKISEDSTVFQPSQVAACIVKGIKRGSYILGTPDLGLAIHNMSIKGMVARSFPGVLLDMIVGCFAPLLHYFFSASMDKVSRKGARQRYAKLMAEAGDT
eukprot:gene881-5711_t